MDLFRSRLESHRTTLPPASLRVADYIDANRAAVLASSALELAARTSTSDATVIRTVQALGFAGLGALKRALVTSVGRPAGLAHDMRRTLADVGEDSGRAIDLVFKAHNEAMRGMRRPAAQASILAGVATLSQAERIAVFGIGPSAALASYVATQLARGGRRTLVLNSTGSMLADQMLDLTPGDGLLAMAYGRAYPEITAVLTEARRLGLASVLVTDSLDKRLRRSASVVVPANRGRAQRVALHGATLVCLEALALGLITLGKAEAVTTLEHLNRLRESVRGG